jgi:hypothetical protein
MKKHRPKPAARRKPPAKANKSRSTRTWEPGRTYYSDPETSDLTPELARDMIAEGNFGDPVEGETQEEWEAWINSVHEMAGSTPPYPATPPLPPSDAQPEDQASPSAVVPTHEDVPKQ